MEHANASSCIEFSPSTALLPAVFVCLFEKEQLAASSSAGKKPAHSRYHFLEVQCGLAIPASTQAFLIDEEQSPPKYVSYPGTEAQHTCST